MDTMVAGRLRAGPGFTVTRAGDATEWDAIARHCPYATFFHTPVWLRAFARGCPPLTDASLRFAFDDGIVAIFPLIKHDAAFGLHHAYMSSAACCYGGPICAAALTDAHLAALAAHVLHAYPNLFWRLNPLQPRARVLDRHVVIRDTTEMLALTADEAPETWRKRYRYSVRKQIHKACRAGLQVREAAGWEEWEAYHRLYLKRHGEWGQAARSIYPLSLFRSLHDARDARIKLWLVWQDDRLAGGNVNMYHGTHCVEWHAAFDRDFFLCGVRDFLVDWIIEDARSRGYALYDFNPSADLEGCRRFKQTFGTASRNSDVIVQRSGLAQLAHTCRQYLHAR